MTEVTTNTGRFGHFKQLDGWRGLSIVFVLVGHGLMHDQPNRRVFDLGEEVSTLGVTCFFILSGFLITGLLCNEESTTGKISLRDFYLKRTLRIMPAYYVMLALSGLVAALGFVTSVPWYTWISAAIYMRDLVGQGALLGHTWSLSLEEQFYLLWPSCLKATQRDKRILFALIGTLSLTSWRVIAMLTGLWKAHLAFRPDFRADGIILGCLLALLWSYRPEVLKNFAGKLPPVWIMFICMCLWAMFGHTVPQLHPILLTGKTMFAAIVMTQLIVCATSGLARICSHSILRWFGTMSYSLYLWQQLFLMAHKDHRWASVSNFPIDLACVFLAAICSYYLIERPALNLRKKLIRS